MRQELMGLEGVVAAEVSYDDAVARVRYQAEQVTPDQMAEAINATGFGATVMPSTPDE